MFQQVPKAHQLFGLTVTNPLAGFNQGIVPTLWKLYTADQEHCISSTLQCVILEVKFKRNHGVILGCFTDKVRKDGFCISKGSTLL